MTKPSPMPAPGTRRWAIAAALLSVVCLLLYRGYAGDDTFIHLQYARNLASGHGFAFNAGEPSYGSTGPAWTLLIAGAGALLGGQFYLAAKLLGFLASAAAVIAFHALARRILPGAALAAVAATFAFAIDPWLLKWGGSGMETPAGILIVLLAARRHLDERERGGVPLASFLLGLGTLVRPELLALFLIALFDRVVFARRPMGETLAVVALFVLPIAPWLLYAQSAFGDVVAATVHAKSGYTSRGEVIVRTAKIVGATYGPLVVAAVLGGLAAWRRAGGPASRPPAERLAGTPGSGPAGAAAPGAWAWIARRTILWGWVLGLPAAYLATKSYVASRYLLIATPFVVLLGFEGATALASSGRGRRAVVFGLLALTVMASVVIQATVIYPRTRFQRGVDENLIAVGDWLRENTPADALVAVHEVGAVGYFSERRILDTAGLVSREALPYVLAYRIADLLRETRADYYVSSGDDRIDRQVFEPLGDRLEKVFEARVQRGGSSWRFAQPMTVGIHRFNWEEKEGS